MAEHNHRTPTRDEMLDRAVDSAALDLAAQTLFQNVGAELDKLLRAKKMSRTAAGKVFDRPESFIASRIAGRNMTLRTLAEMVEMLDATVTISIKPNKK